MDYITAKIISNAGYGKLQTDLSVLKYLQSVESVIMWLVITSIIMV